MLFLHDCHDPLNCSTFTPTNMVGDLYYLLMASLAYTSPCMGVINRLIGCYASGNLYFVYFFCLFFMCGGSVVFLNSLEMEGDEMNILVLKWANQDYFWSQVCEISWDPLIYYWGTWLLALISLQLLLSLLRFICFFLFDVCGLLNCYVSAYFVVVHSVCWNSGTV